MDTNHRKYLDGTLLSRLALINERSKSTAPPGRRRWLAVAIVVWLLISFPVQGRSETFNVNNAEDRDGNDSYCINPVYLNRGLCTLRIAINAANNRPGRSHTVQLAADTYKLKGTLDTSVTVTIRGKGAGLTNIAGSCYQQSKLSLPDDDYSAESIFEECGGDEFRLLVVRQTGLVTLDGLTLRDGQYGGAPIHNSGTLQLFRTMVIRNHAHLGASAILNAAGGRLYLLYSTVSSNFSHNSGSAIINSGAARIEYSTVNNNRGICGGGIWNSGSLSVTNGTISGNKAVVNQVCLAAGGIVNENGSTSLNGVTITQNRLLLQTFDLGFVAGGVANVGTFSFANSIIAKNLPQGNFDGRPVSDCAGGFLSFGGNIMGNDKELRTCVLKPPDSWPADLPTPFRADSFKQDPLLSPLADNGGHTCTHALKPGSPAVNHGWKFAPGSPVCPAYDQRMNKRETNCDSGAFEMGPALFVNRPSSCTP